MNVPSLSPGEKLAVAGGILTLVGSVLPWLTTGEVAVLGFNSDGFMTITFAVSVLGIVALWDWLAIQQAVVGLLGALVAVIAGNYALSIGAPGIGVGAYVTFVAGVLVAGGAGLGLVRSLRATNEPIEERTDFE